MIRDWMPVARPNILYDEVLYRDNEKGQRIFVARKLGGVRWFGWPAYGSPIEFDSAITTAEQAVDAMDALNAVFMARDE